MWGPRFSMVFYAIYGLSISIILKRFGAITRTFINTAAIFGCIAGASSSAEITPLELTTFGVIMLAVAQTPGRENYARRRRRRPKPPGALYYETCGAAACGRVRAGAMRYTRAAHRARSACARHRRAQSRERATEGHFL